MKNLMNLGKTLNKQEQKSINGGRLMMCHCDQDCPSGQWCCNMVCTISGPGAGYCPPQECPISD